MAVGNFNFNGVKEVEWADVRLFIDGVQVTKILGFSYGIDTEKEHLHMEGDDPASIQSGNRKPTGSMTLAAGALDVINAAAVVAGGRDVTDLEMDVAFTYKPKGTRPPVADVCKGVQVSSFSKAMNQNAKNMPVTMPFLFLQLESAV